MLKEQDCIELYNLRKSIMSDHPAEYIHDDGNEQRFLSQGGKQTSGCI